MIDPTKIRPREGWCVLLAEERKTEVRGIYLPDELTNAEKVTEGAGTIIRVGIGDKSRTLGLEPGQSILYRGFLKYAHPIDSGEKWPSGDNKKYFFMNIDDILAVIPPGMTVGAYSGRPMVPELRGV